MISTLDIIIIIACVLASIFFIILLNKYLNCCIKKEIIYTPVDL